MIYMFARQCKLSYCISASNNVTPIACQKISHGSKVELFNAIIKNLSDMFRQL